MKKLLSTLALALVTVFALTALTAGVSAADHGDTYYFEETFVGQHLYPGDRLLSMKEAARQGVNFVWVHLDGGDWEKAPIDEGYTVARNCVITAMDGRTVYWLDTVHTVTFHANGGKCDLSTALVQTGKSYKGHLYSGSEYVDFPRAKKGDDTFLGWFTKAEGGSEVKAGDVCSGDITLYAHWKKSAKVKAKVKPVKDQTYTGSALKPEVKVLVAGEKTVIPASDYTVSYSKNKEVGTAKITVRDKAKDKGFDFDTVTAEFKIVKKKSEQSSEKEKDDKKQKKQEEDKPAQKKETPVEDVSGEESAETSEEEKDNGGEVSSEREPQAGEEVDQAEEEAKKAEEEAEAAKKAEEEAKKAEEEKKKAEEEKKKAEEEKKKAEEQKNLEDSSLEEPVEGEAAEETASAFTGGSAALAVGCAAAVAAVAGAVVARKKRK